MTIKQALDMLIKVFSNPNPDPLVAFAAIEKAKYAVERFETGR